MNDNTPTRPFVSSLKTLGTVLDVLEKWTLVGLLAGIIIFVFSGVLSRFVFHYAIAFTEELSGFMFLWSSLLGAAAALKYGSHGGIPLVANRFGPRGRRFIEIFVAAGVTFFMIYLVVMSSVSVQKSFFSGQISTVTEIPVWTISLGMLLAFAIGVIRSIQGFLLGVYHPDHADPDRKSK